MDGSQEVMQFIIDNNISKFSAFDNTWCLIKPIVTDLSEFKE